MTSVMMALTSFDVIVRRDKTMIRTQIQLTEEQARALKEIAHRERLDR